MFETILGKLHQVLGKYNILGKYISIFGRKIETDPKGKEEYKYYYEKPGSKNEEPICCYVN